MHEASDLPALHLGELHVTASTRTKKRLFGRRPQSIPMVVLTVSGVHTEFDAHEVAELADGPILVSAVTATPAGDYFLVSPSVVEPSSGIGASLQDQQFEPHSLLFLHGQTILAEVSAAQQSDLISWLERAISAQ